MQGKFSWTSGFMVMLYSILGLVLFTSMFPTIMSGLASLYTATGAASMIAWTTIVGIAPVILLLAGAFGAGFAYYKGYKGMSSGGGDASGIMRIVMGVLQIILFVTLFLTVFNSFYAIYRDYCGAANDTVWIALKTVVQIMPTTLFLAGLFSGGMTAWSGARARSKKKAHR